MKAILVGKFPLLSESFIVNFAKGYKDYNEDFKIISIHKSDYDGKLDHRVKSFEDDHVCLNVPINKFKRYFLALFILMNPIILFKMILLLKHGKISYGLNHLFLYKHLRRNRYDLIHSFTLQRGYYSAVAKYLGINITAVTSCFGADVLACENDNAFKFIRNYTDHLSAISKWTKKKVELNDIKIDSVIPMPVDVSLFPANDCAYKENILTVGRFSEEKGHKFAIELIRELKERGYNFKLKIIGSGKLREKYIQQIKKLKLEKDVKILSGITMKQLSKLYSSSLAYIHTAIEIPGFKGIEGQGLVIQESQASMTPVICFDTGGSRESYIPGYTGFLVPQRDIKAMADKIIRLSDEKELRREIGYRGRLFVISEFSTQEIYSKWSDIYGGI
jgi:colanic acid/amylovoran biosynthesis glycosyltransferase